MKTLLTIAGFDPSSGAGITADLMVFAAHHLFGTSCITGLTVQSTVGVVSGHPVAPEVVRSTLECLREDLPPAGVKIGMLATGANAAAVADFLEGLRGQVPGVPVVLDPVLRSSSGRELLDRDGVEVVLERLLPLVDWVTPNLEELGLLTGRSVTRREHLVEAARALQGRREYLNIVAKGGHLEPPDDLVLLRGGAVHWLPGERIVTRSTHGTGCAFSSALLSRLVLGDDGLTASSGAKNYVAEALRTASPLGRGHGPIHHLWPLRRSVGS